MTQYMFPTHTWQVTYSDPTGKVITELIESSSQTHTGQHITFTNQGNKVLIVDQRAMHSARNISVLDMSDTLIDKAASVATEDESHD